MSALAELTRRRHEVLEDAPADTERARRRGQLTARQRIELLLDPGSEWGLGYGLGRDSVLKGFGTIDGRSVAFKAQDPHFRAGLHSSPLAIGPFLNIVDKAALPLFALFQGGGGHIGTDLLSSAWAGFHGGLAGARVGMPRRGALFAAMLGDSYAPWPAAEADFGVMPRNASAAFVNPAIVEAATGQATSVQDVGGAEIHATITGQIDAVAEDDAEAIALLRRAFSYLPGNVWEAPPVVRSADRIDRRTDELCSIVPAYPNRPYDVRRVIESVMDRDSFLEYKPGWARNLVIGLARLDGQTVAVMANQPKHLAGAVDGQAVLKASRLVSLADTFSLPLVTFCDTPGMYTTLAEEHRRLLAISTAFAAQRIATSIPKVCVVIGKGIGFGYFFMSGSEPEGITLAWPNAQIAYLGPEGGVRVVHRRELADEPDVRSAAEKLAEPFRQNMNPMRGAHIGWIDDVIEPGLTRPVLARAVAALRQRSST